jgi:hypothetical protein
LAVSAAGVLPAQSIQVMQKGGSVMHTRCFALLVAMLLSLSTTAAFAQCACGSAAPAAMVPSYAVAPTVAYYAPAVAYYAPPSYVSYYAPVTPYVSYYSPYVTSYAPAYSTYYGYYGGYGVAGWSAYGTPTTYVPGEPVRNVLRAIFP